MNGLPPFNPASLSLPDADLGRVLLGYYLVANTAGIQAKARKEYGVDLSFEEAAEEVRRLVLTLDADCTTEQYDSLLLALQLAAHGKSAAAGKKFRNWLKREAHFSAVLNMTAHMDQDAIRGVKVRRSAKRGHEAVYGTEVEKQQRRNQYQAFIKDLHDKHPAWSYEEMCRRAAKHFSVSLKTIKRNSRNPQKS